MNIYLVFTLHSFELGDHRTHWGTVGESKGSGGGALLTRFVRKVSLLEPPVASLCREESQQGWELKPGTTVAMGCNHWGNMRILERCPSCSWLQPDGIKGTRIRCSGIQARIRTSKINNPQPPSSLCCNMTQKLRDLGPSTLGFPQGSSGGRRFTTHHGLVCPRLPWKDRAAQILVTGIKGRTVMSMA